MSIKQTVQQLEPGALVELFEIDTRTIGGADRFYFHAGTNDLMQPVVWQGITYNPFPVQADGFDMSTRGTLPRPRLRAANVTGILSAAARELDDLVDAKVTRRRTFARYLDEVNFEGGTGGVQTYAAGDYFAEDYAQAGGSGNPEADPTQFLPDDVYYIERKVSEDRNMVEWELTSAMDLEGVKLPSRSITVNTCSWVYRSAECSYTGNSYFDARDNPAPSLSQDVCSKTVRGCKLRFGARGVLPFGGFAASKTYST